MRVRLATAVTLVLLLGACDDGGDADVDTVPRPSESQSSATAAPSPSDPGVVSPDALATAFPDSSELPEGWSGSSPAVQVPKPKPNAKPPFVTDREACNAGLVDVFGARAARVNKETAKGGQTLLGPEKTSLSLELVGFKPGLATGEMQTINAAFAKCYGTGAIFQGAPMQIHELDTEAAGDDFGGLRIDGVEKGKPVTYRIAFARAGDIVVALVDGNPGTSAGDFGAIFRTAIEAADAI